LDKVIRAFIALEMPVSVKDIVQRMQNDARTRFQCHISWTRPEGMHLTLKFLGDTDISLLADLESALQAAVKGIAPLDMAVAEPGHFGGRNPRVIWLGLTTPENLFRLQKEIDQEIHKLGFPLEIRPFHPHITLGRVKNTKGMKGMMAHLKKLPIEKISFQVNELILFQSELKPSGAVYTRLATILLK